NRVRWQSEIYHVEQIKEFRAELKNAEFIFPSPAKRSVLDQRKVELMKRRPTKCIAAQRTKPPLIRPSPSRTIHWDKKERSVFPSPPKIIFAPRSARRKIRLRDKIWPVHTVRAHARLLNPRKNRKRRSTRKRRHIQQLPARRQPLSKRLKKAHAI